VTVTFIWVHTTFWVAAMFWIGIRMRQLLPLQNMAAIALLGGVSLALPVGIASWTGQLTVSPNIPLLRDMAPIAGWLAALFLPQFAIITSSCHMARLMMQRIHGNRPSGIAALFLTSGLASIQMLLFVHHWGQEPVASESSIFSVSILGAIFFLGQLATGLMLVPWFIDKRQARQSIEPGIAWTSLALLTWNLAM
jgi:hypothetical protein